MNRTKGFTNQNQLKSSKAVKRTLWRQDTAALKDTRATRKRGAPFSGANG